MAESINPSITSEGGEDTDDEWQMIDQNPSTSDQSNDDSSNDDSHNAAIESAAMAEADDKTRQDIDQPSPPPPSLPSPCLPLEETQESSLHHRSVASSSSSSANEAKVEEKELGSDEKICRICQDSDHAEDFISPCRCKGSMKYVHNQCLEKWRTTSSNPKSFFECDQCRYKYHFSRTRIGEILASRWALSTMTVLAVFGLVILGGYLLKLLAIFIPMTSDDDIIVEVNEHGDIIVKNSTDISSSSSSSSYSTLSRIWHFIRIDFYHLLYGTIFLGISGFISIFNIGGGFFHGRRWRTNIGGGGSSDRASSAFEVILLCIIITIGLIKASYSVYNIVERKVNQGLLNARNMILNIPEGE